MLKTFLFLLAIVLFIGCTKPLNNHSYIFKNDFESVMGWESNTSVFRGGAHSGEYVTLIDAKHPYSAAFKLPFKDITAEPIYHVNVTFWARPKSLSNISHLVISVDSSGNSVFYQGFRIEESITEADIWTKVKVTAALPATLSENDVIYIYGYEQGGELVLLDDFEIEFITHP